MLLNGDSTERIDSDVCETRRMARTEYFPTVTVEFFQNADKLLALGDRSRGFDIARKTRRTMRSRFLTNFAHMYVLNVNLDLIDRLFPAIFFLAAQMWIFIVL